MIMNFKQVSADYKIGPIKRQLVIDCIDISIEAGSFTAIVGPAGAGKSTLLKMMNGLILPTNGCVQLEEFELKSSISKEILKSIRKKVGLVFQFPESQLFAETVEKDICFGPLNYGVPIEEAKEMAREAIQQVGLKESLLNKSPFSLSGGQKRKVALAGILVMKPEILVLDEPGAGLDPQGKQEMLTLLSALNEHHNVTIVMVTHDMNDVAYYADDMIVLENGKVVYQGEPRQLFSDTELINSLNLLMPDARRLQLKIEKKKGVALKNVCLTTEELIESLIEVEAHE